MNSIIHRSVVRSADDPDKRNTRVYFDTDIDNILDKRDKIDGMPERKKFTRTRKKHDMPVFTMTRGSQEPISQRTRQHGSQRVNNMITREEVEKGIKTNKQHKPNGNMKKLLGALAL